MGFFRTRSYRVGASTLFAQFRGAANFGTYVLQFSKTGLRTPNLQKAAATLDWFIVVLQGRAKCQATCVKQVT